ncbi:hypothetical protein D9M69_605370 [compost metagenome]
MFSIEPALVLVYWPKPRSVTTWSSLVSSATSVPAMSEPRPSCGRKLPVRFREMKKAGTR